MLDSTCQQLLAHSPAPLFIVDLSTASQPRLAGANPAWFKLLGSLDPTQAGQPLKCLLDQGALIRLEDKLRHCLETATGVAYADVLSTPDGERHIETALTPLREADGEIRLVLAMVRDVTEQQRIRERYDLLEYALDRVQEAAYLLDDQARIRYVNRESGRMLGYSRDELLAMSVPDLDPDYPMEQWPAIWSKVKSLGALSFETRHRRKDGHIIPVEITSGYLRYQSQDYEFALVREITERLQSETAMQRLNRTLKTLSSGNAVLVRATSEAELLEHMCKVVVDVGGYQLAWIGFAQAGGPIEVMTSAGIDTNLVTAMDPILRQGRHAENPAHAATRTGEVQIVRESDPVPADTTIHGEPACLGFRACLALPLHIADNAPGVLAIYSQESTAFDSDEQQLLTEMAKNLAYGIHALRVRIERENFVQRLQDSIEATIQALASTVELRDPYTAGHQHRVAELAKAVACELGMPEVQVQVIYLAGMVHDIGKIAIPAEILSKPGRLSEAELILVRTHAEAGYDILKTIEFPWPIAQIVRQHHERLNGSGYPQGLHKDEILIEARILAVCDVVEAMTTHRPYRPGLGIEAALDEIQNGRHELYDARVVDSCLRVIRDLGFRFQ